MKETQIYSTLVQLMREFFNEKGFIEVPTQSRQSILAACENPHSIVKYTFDGEEWPMIQTGQMVLEEELLKNPTWPGVYCLTTSYREEKNPIPGRHAKVFPMFEFEGRGGYRELIKLEDELLTHLGFGNTRATGDYDALSSKYDTSILEDEHESMIWEEFGSVFFLTKFPERTNPFWNMLGLNSGHYEKVDIILYGQETIGSAVRSTNIIEMRNNFHSIENGKYAAKLFELFGKERVEAELEQFLSLPMVSRFGGGIGMTRLARAYKMLNE